jgi:hypothetical protein
MLMVKSYITSSCLISPLKWIRFYVYIFIKVAAASSGSLHINIFRISQLVAWKLWLLVFIMLFFSLLDIQSNGWSKRAPIHLEFPMETFIHRYLHIFYIHIHEIRSALLFPSQQHLAYFFPRVFGE